MWQWSVDPWPCAPAGGSAAVAGGAEKGRRTFTTCGAGPGAGMWIDAGLTAAPRGIGDRAAAGLGLIRCVAARGRGVVLYQSSGSIQDIADAVERP